MSTNFNRGLAAAIFVFLSACGGGSGGEPLDPSRSGGDTTVFLSSSDAFSLPAANLSGSERADFQAGNSFFRNPWVIAPSSTDLRDGLGPIFNVSSCQACHIRDGRGHAPQTADDNADSLLVRLAVPATSPAQLALLQNGLAANIAEPSYGGQIQDRSNPGVPREAKVRIQWSLETVTLDDGTGVELRRPALQLSELGYGALQQDTALSARIAQPMIGLGLLESIPDATILAREDIDDRNRDGISGKANRVFDPASNTTAVLGRFGWKALTPSVRVQIVAAFNGDIGITSRLLPDQPCTAAQTACSEQVSGGEPELDDEVLGLVEFYSQHLAVPGRRNLDDADVRAGEQRFTSAGCAACHVPHTRTGEIEARPQLSNQDIFPYSDLLLHDMGDDLADGVSEFLASGNEWRTPPLWGIGLTQVVAGDQPIGFLHDGRARTLLEAILWHGGEAQSARDAVAAMNETERAQLLKFLESL